MPQLFIHIGLPKTATTFIQHKIFPHYKNICHLKKAKSISIDTLVRQRYDKYLISSEHLLACPFEKKNGDWHEEFETNLINLSQLFPNAHILLSLTDHQTLLTSYYKEYISKPRPFYMGRDEFFDPEKDKGFIKQKDLSFSSIIALVEKHFEQDPFVYLQSEFRNNFDGWLKDLSQYFGENTPKINNTLSRASINAGVKYYPSKLLVFLNRVNNILEKIPIVPTLYNPIFMKLGINPDRICRIHLSKFFKRPLEMTKDQRQFIIEHYEKDWIYIHNWLSKKRTNFYSLLKFKD